MNPYDANNEYRIRYGPGQDCPSIFFSKTNMAHLYLYLHFHVHIILAMFEIYTIIKNYHIQ